MVIWAIDTTPSWHDSIIKRCKLNKIHIHKIQAVPSGFARASVPIILAGMLIFLTVFRDIFPFFSSKPSLIILSVLTVGSFIWWEDLIIEIGIWRLFRKFKRVIDLPNAIPITLKEFIKLDPEISGRLWVFTFDKFGEDSDYFLNDTWAHNRGINNIVMVFDDETDAFLFKVSREA